MSRPRPDPARGPAAAAPDAALPEAAGAPVGPALTRRGALLGLAAVLLAGCGDDGLGARPSRLPDEGPWRTVPAGVPAGTGHRAAGAGGAGGPQEAGAVMPRPGPRRSGRRTPRDRRR